MPFDQMPEKYDLTTSKADRLRFLADFMDGLSDDQVWMPGYVKECGTARCALGWAVTLPEFKALGITDDPNQLHTFYIANGADSYDINPHGFGAFFGLDSEEGEPILMARHYPYPKDEIPASAVVERLREAADKVAAREKVTA